jgi:AcrR family transcriptional regulator|tara:strand:+ start:152 stop:769 length:618 start_codon:yes stop_codon:yes gene_type:complete
MSPKISNKQKALRKEKIAQESLETFKKFGYHDTTMSKISSATNVSKGGLYAYFENKEDLFIFILDYILNQKSTLLEYSYKNKNAFEQLLEQWKRIIFSWDDLDYESTLLIFEFWLEASRNKEYREKLISNYYMTEKYFTKILKDGVKTGEFKSDINAEIITQIFWTYVDGQVQFWLTRNHHPDKKELTLLFSQLKILLMGLRNDD